MIYRIPCLSYFLWSYFWRIDFHLLALQLTLVYRDSDVVSQIHLSMTMCLSLVGYIIQWYTEPGCSPFHLWSFMTSLPWEGPLRKCDDDLILSVWIDSSDDLDVFLVCHWLAARKSLSENVRCGKYVTTFLITSRELVTHNCVYALWRNCYEGISNLVRYFDHLWMARATCIDMW